MRSLIILLISLVSLTPSLALDSIDSLNQVLSIHQKKGDILASIQTLTELGNTSQKRSEFHQAFEYFQQALALSLENGYKEEEVLVKIEIGETLSWMDQYKESLRYHHQALKDKKYLSLRKEANLLTQISQTYRFMGEYAKAAEHQYKGLAISESIQDSMGIVLGHFILSTIYHYSHQNEKSYEEAYEAFEAYQTFYADEVTEYLHVILHGLAAVEGRKENMDKYEYFTRKTMEVALELGDGYTIASSHGSMGSMHFTKETYDSAAFYFQQAVAYFKEHGIRHDQGIYQEHLVSTYRKMNKTKESMEVLDEALQVAYNINSLDLEKRVYEELSGNYEALGRHEKANNYMKKFMVLKDSLEGETNQKRISTLRDQYEIQKREKEIEIIKSEGQSRLNQVYLSTLIIGFTAFLIILWLLYSRYDEKVKGNSILLKKNREIAHQNKQLTSLNDDLLKFSEIVSKDLQGSLQDIKKVCDKIDIRKVASQEDLNKINNHLKDMEEVLYGLIMYSMTGSKEDMFELCDSKELIAQSLRELPSHIRNKSTKVSLHSLPKILANKKKLTQLFLYLVTYALEHQSDHSSIIRISSDENSEEYEFVIQNEGPGIPREIASNIFDVLSPEESTDYSSIELAI
ncbi:MAG: tetratricopeptide repeat protein, partial [Bacteroidota bacterium]